MKEPKVMTYEEWLAEYYPYWEDEEGGDCPECEGKGSIECPTCGAEDYLDCEYCNGSGSIIVKENHRDEYNVLKKSDLELWEKWVGMTLWTKENHPTQGFKGGK